MMPRNFACRDGACVFALDFLLEVVEKAMRGSGPEAGTGGKARATGEVTVEPRRRRRTAALAAPPGAAAALRPLLPALALALALAGAGAAAAGGTGGEGKGFRDAFDRFDRTRWYVSDGWRNGAWQDCDWSARAVGLSGGMLRLSYLPGAEGAGDGGTGGDGAGARCGEVQSRAAYGYGTYEARLRAVPVPGRVAAFFTYTGPVRGDPHDEIDIELPGAGGAVATLTAWRDGERRATAEVPAPPAAGGFLDVAFVWAPGRLTWFVDGAPVFRATGAAVPVTPQKIMFSHWGSDAMADWLGRPAAGGGPSVLEVDFVAFTPLGAPCQWPGSVACTAAATP